MKILEIKNNLVKISYDVDDNLALSGFAVIEDKNCPYVAQIVNLKADGGTNYAILKLLFTFDEAGILKLYNGTIPSENAEITLLPTKEILELFRSDSPIFLGTTAQNDYFNLDLDVFMSGLLVCSNSLINTGKLLTNIFPQIVKRNKKVVLLDATGDYYTENSFVFGKHFKLPLNCEFLDYIFDNDLEGVEPVSKAVIQDIFSEVKDYIRSIPQGYLPIDLLINVVQEQYAETKIPELVLLKNKLIRYKEANVFASGNDDVFILRSKVSHTDSLILDVSQVDCKFIRKLIEFVYDTFATVDSDICVFATMGNDFADKKLLRKTMEYGNIHTTIICAHEFKYLPDLKQIIPNLILFAPQTLQHDFAGYNTFLSKLNPEEFIVYGEYTQKIPFIVQLTQYDESMLLQNTEVSDENTDENEEEVSVENELNEMSQDDLNEGLSEFEDDDNSLVAEESSQEDLSENPIQFEDSENTSENEENTVYDEESSSSEDENVFEEQKTEDKLNVEESNSEETVNENSYDDSGFTFEDDEITFADDNSEETVSAEDAPIPTSDEETEEDDSFENDILTDREILEEQVANDVDASLYKKNDEEEVEDSDKVSPDVLTKSDEITNEDLDYIEALDLSDDNVQETAVEDEEEKIEIVETAPETENSELDAEEDNKTVVEENNETVVEDDNEIVVEKNKGDRNYNIPIYTPEEFKPEPEIEEETAPTFKTGDVITHPKYGQGVVEKMINYGNKTLCSINFVNLGRRLLDPSISDIQLLGRDGATV